jgi:hypothetical protein
MPTNCWSTSIGIAMTSTISTSMHRMIRKASRIAIGIAMQRWCIVIRITLTCIIATVTSTQIEGTPSQGRGRLTTRETPTRLAARG